MKYTIPLLIIFTLTYSVLAQNDTTIFPVMSSASCPSPLVVRQPYDLVKNDSQICLNDCCLACPFINNFYEENKIEKTFQVFAVLGVISFCLMIVLSIFFVVLPSQKQNPLSKLVLLPLALSVAYFEGSEFFTLNQRQSQCNDSITSADPSSNKYCLIQSIFTLGGGYAIACYSALLMTHLHLISIWRTEFITNKILYFHLLIIGSCMAATIIPITTHHVQSTNICFISLDKASSYFYFLSFIYIAFAAHLTTIIYMAHISIKSNSTISTVSRRTSIIEAQRKLNHLKTIFKLQWRALFGSLLMLVLYVLNWYYYVFSISLLARPALTIPWIRDWIMCLKYYGNQDLCASKISNNTPSYNYIVILLFFNRTAGILIFIIFAAKKVVLMELYDIIRGKKLNSRPNQHVSYYETESGRWSLRPIRNSIRRVSTVMDKYSKKGNYSAESTTLGSSSTRESTIVIKDEQDSESST